jgi:hypothetical protein
MKQTDNILSDLAIIRQIKAIQRQVLEQYHVHVARILVPKYGQGVPNYGLGVGVNLPPRTPALRDVKRMREALYDDDALPDEKKSVANWTLECADESELFLSDQYKQIDNLYKAAEHCHKRLEDLLDTKNRYAGIVSAWEAVANSVEQSNQGKSIMLFSVLSIIFVSPPPSHPQPCAPFVLTTHPTAPPLLHHLHLRHEHPRLPHRPGHPRRRAVLRLWHLPRRHLLLVTTRL